MGKSYEVILPRNKEKGFHGTRGPFAHWSSGERHKGPWQPKARLFAPLCMGCMVFPSRHFCIYLHIISCLLCQLCCFCFVLFWFFCLFVFALLFSRFFLNPWFLFTPSFPRSKFLTEHDPSWPLLLLIITFLQFPQNYVCNYMVTGLGQWACLGVRKVEPNYNNAVGSGLPLQKELWNDFLYKRYVSDRIFDELMIEIMKHLPHVFPHQLKRSFYTCKKTRGGSVTNRDAPSLEITIKERAISYILPKLIITISMAMINQPMPDQISILGQNMFSS